MADQQHTVADAVPTPRPERLHARALALMLTDQSARGIADRLGHLIYSGELAQGLHLPTVRALAAALHVGPTTIASAWAQLRQRGLIHCDRRHGSVIRGPGRLAGRRYASLPLRSAVRLDLSTALPDPALLPDLAVPMAEAVSGTHWRSYPDDAMDVHLAAVLHGTWPFEAEDFVVTSGAHDAVHRVADVVLHPHDRVLVEEVAAASLLDIVEDHQAQATPIRCDDEGPLPEALEPALASQPRMLLLQSRMASPHGHALSRRRARALVPMLAASDVVIVEQDTAHELAPTPDVSLGEFLPEQTLLVRSWNKSHGPHLRVGALAGIRRVVARVRARQKSTGSWPSVLTQRALAQMLTDPQTQETIRLARCCYRQRRHRMVRALHDHGLAPTGVAGLSVWVHVHNAGTAIRSLAGDGIGIASGAPFVTHGDGRSHVRIGTTLPHDQHAHIARTLGAAHRGQPL
ncbi:GntR family transcriptional regulator [Plantactinospora soyae]|uniref:DNA-binding transcriptional MocR family regulator n=1 Tax=Plantactinospora soyae TaxID=1544732 RepID=A0A927M7Z5_9ACTN|nr:GntR family transcriptional regulator [Plantactinospora soyae]MBE1489454.1 DNA-binding transcriptional MocR family regulator [Plantactinospora soyae]